MATRSRIEDTIRSFWAARVRGDMDEMMKALADDVVFELNGRGTGAPDLGIPARGKTAVGSMVQQLIDAWRFDDWKEISLLVDGERASLHWKARATCVPTGKSDWFDVFDAITFRDGKIVNYRQNTDTALIVSLATP